MEILTEILPDFAVQLCLALDYFSIHVYAPYGKMSYNLSPKIAKIE
jgi:hypothetical protein